MTTIRVAGVPEPYNLPWHRAMEKGLFVKAGIDLQWHTVPEGSGRMCQMLRDDELDMAVLVTEAAVRDIQNGGPHRIVSTFVESPLPWGVHVPAASALRIPTDLQGVPFAISRKGSGSHLMAMLYAQKLSWKPVDSDFIIVNSMEGAAERMKSGEPMVFLWEKFVTSRYVDAGIMRKVDEIQGDWPGFVIVAREGFLHSNAHALNELLRSLRQEVKTMEYGTALIPRVVRSAGFPELVAQAWLEQVQWAARRPDEASLKGITSALLELDLVPGNARRALLS